MVVARHRERSLGFKSGTMRPWFDPDHPVERVISLGEEVCDDFGTSQDLPFSVHSRSISGGTVTGIQPSGTVFNNFPCERYVGIDYPQAHLPTTLDFPSDAVDQVLKRTYPGKPLLDLPVSIAELRDIPHMFRIVGDGFFKKSANSYLLYQFGWKNFFNDLRNVFVQFPNAIARRNKQLQDLKKYGSKVKVAKLGSDSASFIDKHLSVTTTGGLDIYVDHSITTTVDLWGFARWRLSDFGNMWLDSDSAIVEEAKRSLLGLDNPVKSFYDALPWTWLIDWFVNLGDILERQGNALFLEPGEVCLCRSTRTELKTTWTNDSRLKPLSGVLYTKERTLRPSSTLTAHIPMLDAGSVGILSSLIIQRHRG